MAAGRREVLAIGLRALAWLPVALAAWYFASTALAWAPVRLAVPALGLAGVQAALGKLEDGTATIEARLHPPYRPGVAAVEAVDVAIEVKTRTFTFGLALFLALTLALGRPWNPGRIALGSAVLVILPAWSVAFDALRQLSGEAALAPVLGWAPATREAIAFGYQLGSLLLPALAPVALWIALNPRLARTPSEEDQPGGQ
jgi:hypothetical protein